VVEVVDVVDDVDVVDVEVDVDAAVVTGVVVEVVPDSDDVVTPLSPTTDDEVAPESVVASSSPPQLAIVSAMRMRGSRRVDFTGGSLSRDLPIT
jgi:hypothetical protein